MKIIMEKDKALRLFAFLFLFMAAVFLWGAPVYGATQTETPSSIEEVKEQTKDAIYNVELNAPFSKETSGIREDVNTETGALVIENQFLSLPGAGGMDLNLSLTYNNQNAKLYDEGTACGDFSVSSDLNKTLTAFYDVYNSAGYWVRTDSMKYDWTDDTITGTVTKNGETWVFTGYFQREGESELKSASGKKNSVNKKSVIEASKSVFGEGWSLDIPYLYVDGKSVYVTVSNGQTYKYDAKASCGLKDYPLLDMYFSEDTSVGNGTDSSAYRLQFHNGRQQYFTKQGELLLERDKYGNEITYFWGEQNGLRLLMKITDTIGKTVMFSYDELGTLIQYDDKKFTFSKAEISGKENKYVLSSYKDPLGNATDYSYSFDTAEFDNFGGTAVFNTYANLKAVQYQTGIVTNYNYITGTKNLGAGHMVYFKVSQRNDSAGTQRRSVQRYNYYNEPDGYPGYKSKVLDSSYTYSTEVLDEEGKCITYTYNYKHLLTDKITAAEGIATIEKTEYDPHKNVPSKVTTIRRIDGKEHLICIDTYTFDIMGNLISENHPADPAALQSESYVINYVYDPAYNILIEKSYLQDEQTKITETYTLDKGHRSVVQADVYQNNFLKKRNSFIYDDKGRLLQQSSMVEEDKWAIKKYTYDDHYPLLPSDIVCGEADNASGNAAAILSREKYTYDSTGKPVVYIDGNGNRITYEYDLLERQVKENLPDGCSRTFDYDDHGNRIVTVDAAGAELLYVYDPFGYLQEVQKILTGETILQRSYDARGNLIRSVDGNGNSSVYTYDALNRVKSSVLIDKNGKKISEKNSFYDENNKDLYGTIRLKETTVVSGDSENIVTVSYYDGRGRLVKSGRVNGLEEQTEEYYFDYLGNQTGCIGFDGTKVTKTYDAFGNILSETDGSGRTVTYGYDFNGNLVWKRNGLNELVFSHTYDGLGRKISAAIPMENGMLAETLYEYDGAGNLICTTDAKGQSVAQGYNARGFLIYIKQIVDSEKLNIVSYDHDGEGRVTAQRTGLSAWDDTAFSTHTYVYDAYGFLLKETDGAGESTAYQYDGNGNCVVKTDRNGVATYYTYDGANRVIEEYNSKDGKPNGTRSVYDLNGNLVSKANAGQTAAYSYDTFGRMNKISYDGGLQKQYTYDCLDRVCVLTVTLGSVTELEEKYEYDPAGRLTALVYEGTRSSYDYDEAGRLVKEVNGLTGIETKYRYNPSGTLQKKASYQGEDMIFYGEYEYDPVGNQVCKEENGDVTEYTYDALSRLRTAVMPDGTILYYEYDDFSNISSRTEISGTKIIENKCYYDPVGRLCLQECPAEDRQTRYEYDKAGNLIYRQNVQRQNGITFGDEQNYQYNGSNQLSAVFSEGEIYEYTYGIDGLRNSKVRSDGETTEYVYEKGNILLETDGENRVAAKNIWGDRLLIRDAEDIKYSYVFDGHGNILALTDEQGTVLEDYAYDPYGNEIEMSQSQNPLLFSIRSAGAEEEYDNPFRYCGEYLDGETGYYYLRARYYDPETGRFLSEDPIKDGQNWYVYCNNNPVNYNDAEGLSGIKKDGSYYITHPLDKNLLKLKQEYETASQKRKKEIAKEARKIRKSGEENVDWSVQANISLNYYKIDTDVTQKLNELLRSAEKAHSWKKYGELTPITNVVRYADFAWMVRPGGRYDLKSKSEWQGRQHFLYEGKVIWFDDPGNILYGYLGKAMGFEDIVLKSAAGAVQIIQGNSDIKYVSSYFDDPRDQRAINMGIQKYKDSH